MKGSKLKQKRRESLSFFFKKEKMLSLLFGLILPRDFWDFLFGPSKTSLCSHFVFKKEEKKLLKTMDEREKRFVGQISMKTITKFGWDVFGLWCSSKK